MQVLDNPTPILFFTGKGGVGKTSLSCATAVALADAGKKVLLVSTDPASNIHEVFGQDIETQPTEIAEVPGDAAAEPAEELRRRRLRPPGRCRPIRLRRSA